MEKLFFDSWQSIFRTLIITVLAYFILIFLLRISGKRTLSKMNAFDFVVTIALGSTLATMLLNKSVSLADGVLALGLLIGLQYIITYAAVRSKQISSIVKDSPVLLVYNGELIRKAMIVERVNEDEIYAAIRKNGLASLTDAKAVILETDGSMNILKYSSEIKNNTGKPETLKTVSNISSQE